MGIVRISDKIRCIEASDDPLSADIGIIDSEDGVWLYDVGNGAESISSLKSEYNVVLSHFHTDHTGNIGRIRARCIYSSRETREHIHDGVTVDGELRVGEMRIFTLPSCHAKGCLGLEVGEMYAFVGDALYCRVRDGFCIYNAQLLRDEIKVLEALRAPYLLVSHLKGMIREKADALDELRKIYGMRDKCSAEIRIPIK